MTARFRRLKRARSRRDSILRNPGLPQNPRVSSLLNFRVRALVRSMFTEPCHVVARVAAEAVTLLSRYEVERSVHDALRPSRFDGGGSGPGCRYLLLPSNCHFPQRRAADPAEELPRLSSSRPNRADVSSHLCDSTPVAQSDQDG